MSHINVTDLIDRRPIGSLQRRVAYLCAVVAALDGFDTQVVGYMAPAITSEWGLPNGAFGPVFGAGMLGLALGSVAGGPLADRWGRKLIIILASLFFGACSVATVWATDIEELVSLRLLTGLGLGAAIPNLIALTSEFAPARNRALVVTLMFSGFPLGSILGGVLGAVWIPEWGWRSLFYLGGGLPILWALILVRALPESPSFLVASGASPIRIQKLMRDVDPEHEAGTYVINEPIKTRSSVLSLFVEKRMPMTLLLWLAFFMNLLVMYFFVNWLPTLLTMSNYSLSRAIQASTAFNVGGLFGGFVLAAAIRRVGYVPVLSTSFVIIALAIAGTSQVSQVPYLVFPAVFVVGFGVVGAQFCLNALAADLYPTAMRSTGIGWALGVGRIGSVIGPVLGGLLLDLSWQPSELVFACIGPAMVAGAAIFWLSRLPSVGQGVRVGVAH